MEAAEAIAQAFKLFVMTVGYALELARKRQEAIAEADRRRSLFERALVLALERMNIAVAEENRRIDAVDQDVDQEAKKH